MAVQVPLIPRGFSKNTVHGQGSATLGGDPGSAGFFPKWSSVLGPINDDCPTDAT